MPLVYPSNHRPPEVAYTMCGRKVLDTGKVKIGIRHQSERWIMDKHDMQMQRLLLIGSPLVLDEAAVTMAMLDLME